MNQKSDNIDELNIKIIIFHLKHLLIPLPPHSSHVTSLRPGCLIQEAVGISYVLQGRRHYSLLVATQSRIIGAV